jgi:hypothetical protein
MPEKTTSVIVKTQNPSLPVHASKKWKLLNAVDKTCIP